MYTAMACLRYKNVDIETFCDPERMHCKEGLVTSEEEHGLHFNVRWPNSSPLVACTMLNYSITRCADVPALRFRFYMGSTQQAMTC